MSAATLTSLAPITKILYGDRLEKLLYEDEPFWAWLPKMTTFEGESKTLPLQYAPTSGRSTSFLQAQGNTGASKLKKFTITRVKDYAVAHLDRETMKATEHNKGALVTAVMTEGDAAVNSIRLSIASALTRNGTGAIGQISTTTAPTTTLTLVQAADAHNFYEGQSLVASDDDGGALRVGVAVVTAVNPSLGTVTVDVDNAAWAVGDYLYVNGDAQAGASAAIRVSGLASWIPSTTPSATAFFGVDRTAHPDKLAGIRHDGSTQTYQEAFIRAIAKCAMYGGQPETIWMNHLDYANFVLELGSNVQFDIVKSADGKFGFDAIKMHSPGGKVNVMCDRNMPVGKAYALKRSTWKLYSLGEAPHVVEREGEKFVMREEYDELEMRLAAYFQLGCSAPGWNAVITLPT